MPCEKIRVQLFCARLQGSCHHLKYSSFALVGTWLSVQLSSFKHRAPWPKCHCEKPPSQFNLFIFSVAPWGNVLYHRSWSKRFGRPTKPRPRGTISITQNCSSSQGAEIQTQPTWISCGHFASFHSQSFPFCLTVCACSQRSASSV